MLVCGVNACVRCECLCVEFMICVWYVMICVWYV